MKVDEIGEASQRGMKKTTVEVKEHIPIEENLILTQNIYIYIEREREREENLRLSFSSSSAGRESETERWRAWEKGGWDWVANIKESESVGESLSTPSESGNGLDDNVEGGLEGVADGGLKEWKCGWVGEGMRVRVRVRDSWMAERRIDRVGIRVWYKWYLYIELGFFFFFGNFSLPGLGSGRVFPDLISLRVE